MVLGGLLAAGGLFMMSFLTVDSGFWELAFPGQLLLGLGLGFTFVPLSNLALIGAGAHDAGAASAMLNATQQVGASIGTALLATLSVGAITNYFTDVATSGGDPHGPRGRPAGAGRGLHDRLHLGRRSCSCWVPLVSGRAHQGHQGGPARGGRGARGVVGSCRCRPDRPRPPTGARAVASQGCCSAIARRRAL